MCNPVIDSQKDWFLRKVEIADSVFSQYGFDGESDAEILLCCVVSALASKMWPGNAKDRNRFTEFLVRFTPSNIDVQIISIPVLVAKLKDKNRTAEADILINNYLRHDYGGVFTSDAIDQSEDTIASLCPDLESKTIRRASYVDIIYTDLRCGLVHQMSTTKYVFHDFPLSDVSTPYYANLLVDSNPNLPLEHPLCFPYNYIRDIVVKAIENAFTYRDTVTSRDTLPPEKWWIEGK